MPTNKDPTLELDSETLDYVFAHLERYLEYLEEELGYFPYQEVIASLFFFATLIAKTNNLSQKDYLTLAKKIFSSDIPSPTINKEELN